MKKLVIALALFSLLGLSEEALGDAPDAGPSTSTLKVPQEAPRDAGGPDAGVASLPQEPLEEQATALADALRTGSAIAIAGALITLLVSLLRSRWTGALVQLIPARWRVAVPVFLSGCAGVIANVGAGMPWAEALLVGLFAGPTAVFAHEAVAEALLGQRRSRAATVQEVG